MSNLRRRLLLDSPQYNKSEFEFGFDKVPSEVSGDKSYVHSIKGNSQVWNQLLAAINAENYRAVGKVTISDGALVYTGTGSGWYQQVNLANSKRFDVIAGHKYLLSFDVPVNTITSNAEEYFGFGTAINAILGFVRLGDTTGYKSGIITVNTSATVVCVGFASSAGKAIAEGETASVKNIQLTDLTLLGIDNLTTVTQVEEWLEKNIGKQDYYDYNPGTILNNKTEQVEVVGFNQWDEEWESGALSRSTGLPVDTPGFIRSKNFSPAFGSTSYYINVPSGTAWTVLWYDANHNYIDYNAASTPGSRTSYQGAAYFKIYIAGTTYNHDICINIRDANRNGEYEPHKETTIPLNLALLKGKLLDSQGQPTGSSVVISPNGLAGKGSWRDYCIIEGGYITKVVKKTGEVDLGTLNWTFNVAYYATFTSAKLPTNDSVKANILCEKYLTESANAVYYHRNVDKIIGYWSQSGGRIIIYDSSFTDVATFSSAMSGVKLVYELATPQTYLLDTPIPLTNRVDNGGTKRRLPEDTASSVSAPFSCDVAYDTINTNTNSIERVNATEEFVYDNISIDKPVKRGTLTKIKGKSLVWNQVVSGTNSELGITATMDANNVIHLTGTTASIFFNPFITLYGIGSAALRDCPLGKYYLHVEILNNPDSLPIRVSALNSRIQFGVFPTDTTKSYSLYGICSNASASGGFGLSGFSSGTVFNDVQIQVSLINLTLMFGSGNEPSTVEEFEKLYPLSYYDYNAGTIVNNTTSALEIVGFNLWDEEWEEGLYNSTGGKMDYTGTIRSKNAIEVLPNTAYYINQTIRVGNGLFFFDENENFISRLTGNVSNFTTPTNCTKVRFDLDVSYGTTYNHDICINLSDTSRNGQYEPYWKNTLNLNITSLTGKLNGEGNSVTIVPTGLKSAGTVYDYGVIEKGKLTKIVKCIREVDLGTRNWSYRTWEGHLYFIAHVSNPSPYIDPNGAGRLYNLICAKYTSDTWAHIYYNVTDKVVGIYHNESSFVVYDSAYTDAPTFKAAMAGVLLYYELATPEVYILDNPVPVSLLTYKDCTVKQIPENTSTVITATNVEVIKNQIH